MTRQKLLTAIFLISTILVFEFSNLDVWVQDLLYSRELNQWLIDRHNQLLKVIFYSGIKKVYILLILLALSGSLLFRKSQFIQNNKRGLLIVFFSVILVPLVVNGIKSVTNVPCPKHIERYGGDYPYVSLLDKYPASFKQAENVKCYPAGHASGGFALLSLFFLFKKRNSRVIALVTVMAFSWSIGAYKMLIGDHFLSHTLVTMFLSWLIILIIASCVRRQFSTLSASP